MIKKLLCKISAHMFSDTFSFHYQPTCKDDEYQIYLLCESCRSIVTQERSKSFEDTCATLSIMMKYRGLIINSLCRILLFTSALFFTFVVVDVSNLIHSLMLLFIN